MRTTLNDIVRNVLIQERVDSLDEGFLDDLKGAAGRFADTAGEEAREYGEALKNVGSQAAQFGGRVARAALNTLVGQAHAPESARDVKTARASNETLPKLAASIALPVLRDLFLVKYKIGAKLLVGISPDKKKALNYLEARLGKEAAEELVTGSILHDIALTLSFTPQTAVAAMLFDASVYAIEEDREAAVVALAMAGMTHSLNKLAPEQESLRDLLFDSPSGMPKGAKLLPATAVHPIPADDLAKLTAYDDIAAAAAEHSPTVSLRYFVFCEACYRVPLPASAQNDAVQAIREMGERIEQNVPGARGITDEAANRVRRGDLDIQPILNADRMRDFQRVAGSPDIARAGEFVQETILDIEKYNRSMELNQGLARNIRDPIDYEIARQSAMHGETGSFRVPVLPAADDVSARVAEKSKQNLKGAYEETAKKMSPNLSSDTLERRIDAATGPTGAGQVIAGLSRYGIELKAAFMSTNGRSVVVVKSPAGKTYAYYKSSGSGSGTGSGTWTPYEGNTINFSADEGALWVAKFDGPGGKKVPYVGAGDSRYVFDALNHPHIRDGLGRVPQTHNYDIPFPDSNNLYDLPLREMVDQLNTIADENAMLASQGVILGESLSRTGSETAFMTTYLFPWPANKPVPSQISGRALRMDDLLTNVRTSVMNSSRFPDGVYDLNAVIRYNMSFASSPETTRSMMSQHKISTVNIAQTGNAVVGPYSSYTRPVRRPAPATLPQ